MIWETLTNRFAVYNLDGEGRGYPILHMQL